MQFHTALCGSMGLHADSVLFKGTAILGPLLFIMYINELTNLGLEFDVTIHSYADDTTVYIGFSFENGLQNAMKNIKCCLKKN